MKCALFLVLSILLNSAIAQLVVDTDLLIQSEDAMLPSIPLYFDLELEGQDSVWVHWELVDADNMPLEWENWFYDNNNCYPHFVRNTPTGSYRINRFYEGEPMQWSIHLAPDGIEGSSSITVIVYYLDYTTANHTPLDFTDIEYDGDTLSTSPFNIGLDIGESVDVDEFMVNPIIIYPNPTNDLIRLENDERISFISIYNTLGERLKEWQHRGGQSYNIDHLRNGIYFVKLMDSNNQNIKTVKLYKR